jgi:hypothetical protein
MRASVLAVLLLASSSLCSFAQEQGKAPQAGPSTQIETPATTDPKSSPPLDQNAGREQQRADDREMGRDWKLRRNGESERAGREDREIGRGEMMRRGHGDRMGFDRDYDKDRGRYMDRGRYQERGDRAWDRMDRDGDYRGYDDDRPRRRIKVCVEYDNGDEYCRYRN